MQIEKIKGMFIIHKNSFIITDTYTNKQKYTVFIVSNSNEGIEIPEGEEKGSNITIADEKGYSFSWVDRDHVHITIDYNKITAGKCALISSLITKTEIEQLTSALWNEYCKTLDKELMGESDRINLSEDFFSKFSIKKTKD